MLPQWANMLSWWQWGLIAAVPPAIIALYFLKLKRLPLEVPSTYLWHKSIEDLHVNSIWQRLRQSLLLLLQLLLILLAIFALMGPNWRGTDLAGNRFIFLVDNSASMTATDVEPTRLDEAKRQVGILIDQMKSGDAAMIVSFSDSARVEQLFTQNRKELRRQLAEIRPTQRTTSLSEALKVASGLVNPGQSRDNAGELSARLFIFSDGKFEDVKGFSLGNLEPVYIPIGQANIGNVGIVAFSTRQHEDDPDRLQAFARLENYGSEEVTVQVELHLNDALADASAMTIAPGEASGTVFDLDRFDSGVLMLKLTPADALAVDNIAWTTVNKPRRVKVLLVTTRNEPLQFALGTGRASELAEVRIEGPEYLATPEYRRQSGGSAHDLVIYDRCQPTEMPQANTFFVGALPPGNSWKAEAKVAAPQIIDTDRTHPLMQLIELGDVLIAEGTPLTPPEGSTTLIDSDVGILFAISPREGFEDAVLGFELVGDDTIGTNWPVRLSFPVFVLNVLQYLGGSQDSLSSGSVRPGRPVTLQTDAPAERLSVRTPSGKTVEVKRGKFDAFSFAGTDQVGVYSVRLGSKTIQRFAVNLFDSTESDIEPRPENAIKIGHVTVTAKQGVEAARREGWKVLVLLALVVLAFEWYIYNRRVYL